MSGNVVIKFDKKNLEIKAKRFASGEQKKFASLRASFTKKRYLEFNCPYCNWNGYGNSLKVLRQSSDVLWYRCIKCGLVIPSTMISPVGLNFRDEKENNKHCGGD